MKKLQLLASLLLILCCFSCSGQGGISKSEKEQIAEVIENHDKTLIFVGAKYCHACKNMLENNIKPYLEGLEKNDVGIVIIYYGEKDAVADLMTDNRLILSPNSQFALFIKKDANKTLKSLLKDFKETNAMPIPLLVDKDGVVLNYDKEDGYPSYSAIFGAAK
jgi:thiol-disulfide isomerase/thioredoxin